MIVEHVLGDCHKNAFVALDSVAGFDLGACKNGYADSKDDCHDAYGLFRENALNPFTKILVQETEKSDSQGELYYEKVEGEIQIPLSDEIFIVAIGFSYEIYKERNGYGDYGAEDAGGVS